MTTSLGRPSETMLTGTGCFNSDITGVSSIEDDPHGSFVTDAVFSWTPKKMAQSTGVTTSDRTAANDSPNMMHTAIAPKNGSFSSGIIPRTVVSTTMHTGRILLTLPSRIAW